MHWPSARSEPTDAAAHAAADAAAHAAAIGRRRRALTGLTIAALVLFAGILALGFRLPGRVGGTARWPGYYTIVARGMTPAFLAALEDADIGDVVSFASTVVQIAGLSPVAAGPQSAGGTAPPAPMLETVPLTRLTDRLSPVDPRYDAYLRGLPHYFRTPDGHDLVYVAGNRNPIVFATQVWAALRRTGPAAVPWFLAEWQFVHAVLILAAFAVVVGAASALAHDADNMHRRSLVLSGGLGALAWLPVITAVGSSLFVAVCATYLCWLAFLEVWYPAVRNRSSYGSAGDERPRVVGRGLVLALATVGLLVSAAVIDPRAAGAAALAVFGVALATVAVTAGELRRLQVRQHRPFVPVSILPAARPAVWDSRLSILFVAIVPLTLGLPALAAAIAPNAAAVLPRPLPVSGERPALAFSAIAAMEPAVGEIVIPNLHDFLAHRAFQEALLFGRDYRVPYNGERVVLYQYSDDQNSVAEAATQVMVFDDQWFSTTIAGLPPTNVERLMLAAVGAVALVPANPEVIYFGSALHQRQSVIVFVVLSPFLVAWIRRRFGPRATVVHPLLRRNKLEV